MRNIVIMVEIKSAMRRVGMTKVKDIIASSVSQLGKGDVSQRVRLHLCVAIFFESDEEKRVQSSVDREKETFSGRGVFIHVLIDL